MCDFVFAVLWFAVIHLFGSWFLDLDSWILCVYGFQMVCIFYDLFLDLEFSDLGHRIAFFLYLFLSLDIVILFVLWGISRWV